MASYHGRTCLEVWSLSESKHWLCSSYGSGRSIPGKGWSVLSLETPFNPASKDKAVPGSSSGIPLVLKWQSLSFVSKWKGPNFFVFSTSSQKMTVRLSDGTENFLGEYWQPIASDFEGSDYGILIAMGKWGCWTVKETCAARCKQKRDEGQDLQMQLTCAA